MDLSIIIPTYNRSSLLERCLESLMGQDYPKEEFEVIVCDDGSTDNTKEIVSFYADRYVNVRYLYQPHKGVAAARNLGIRNSLARLIAFVADDYMLDSQYIRTSIEFFKTFPDAWAMRFKLINESKGFLSRFNHFRHEISLNNSLRGEGKSRYMGGKTIKESLRILPYGGVVYRSLLFEKIGSFNESFSRGEDTEFSARCRLSNIPVNYYDLPFIKRVYNTGLSQTMYNSYMRGVSLYRIKRAYPGWSGSMPDKSMHAHWTLLVLRSFHNSARIFLRRKDPSCIVFLPFMLACDLFYAAGVLKARKMEIRATG